MYFAGIVYYHSPKQNNPFDFILMTENEVRAGNFDSFLEKQSVVPQPLI